MKQILIEKVWPVFLALLVASAIMMVCEFINSHFFPFPADLDWSDRDAVAAFTDSLPWTAYILVFLGWATGSFMGAWVAVIVSKVRSLTLPLTVGGILLALGILNNMMLDANIALSVVTLPIFILFAYLGGQYGIRRASRTQTPSLPA